MEMSIKEYSGIKKISRFTVIKQINEKRLPDGITAKKIGNMYVLNVPKFVVDALEYS